MNEKLFRYEQVVLKIEELIHALGLKPGDRIPSVRNVSKELEVSAATVFQAYDILQARGVIEARPKSGFYVAGSIKNTASCKLLEHNYLPLPAKVEMNTMATTMMKNSREYGITNFSILAPVNELLPILKLNKAVQSGLRESTGHNFQYPLVEGHPRLLKQISLSTVKWPNMVSQEQVLVTNGCMEAINLCLDAIAVEGDTIAVESPTYHGILQSLERKKLKVIEIPTNPQTGIVLEELEKALENHQITACVFMPRANNPLGASMSEDAKMALVEMLGSRNIPLIEDDALGDLQFSNLPTYPARAYDKYDNVMYCTSFSKTLAPGFRVGWVAGGKYHSKIEKLKFGSNISTTGVLQDAVGRYLESGQYGAHLRKLTLAVQTQAARYADAIHEFFPKETRVAQPLAGLSLWIELPGEIDAIEFQRASLAKGIGLCPGHIFSMTGMYNNFIRINFCPLWTPKIKQALSKLGTLVHELSASGHKSMETSNLSKAADLTYAV